jgi:ribosomal protein S12 methylthiotransferase accessory factor YcaO
MAGCLQARLGVLVEVTERDFAQIPLAVAQVRVSDPVLLLEPGVPLPVVTGAGLSLAEARRAAVLRGLAAYGSLMVDPRRLHVRGDAPSLAGDPGEDLAALRAGQWSGFVWGHGLADSQPHALAAEAVFPALRRVRPGDPPPPGAAAGYDWHEAVRVGLIGQCRRLALAEIDAGRHRFRRIGLDDVALDAHGSRYRSMAKIIGGVLDVYDVTGSAGMPTLAFCRDGITIAYASGFSFGEAVRDGLADVLLSDQAEASGDAAYAPASVPPLPESLCLPGLTACPTWSTDVTATAARLARLGWKAVAVPLDHDTAVTRGILPYLVNVVVTRD